MSNKTNTKPVNKLAYYSGISALLAFIACNGLIALTAVLAMVGITFNINPHLQALLISVFAILTSVFAYKGFQSHRKPGPLVMATLGTLVIVLTMYVSYSKLIESAGLLALIVAAIWNWHASRQVSSSN